MIFGKQDTHVPRAGRDAIRKELEDANVTTSVRTFSPASRLTADFLIQFVEVQAQHAFIRDESSKGRWDAALTRALFGLMMEVFDRTVARDLGAPAGQVGAPEHVC